VRRDSVILLYSGIFFHSHGSIVSATDFTNNKTGKFHLYVGQSMDFQL